MAYLKYYLNEKLVFPEAYNRKMTDIETIYIFKKLKTKYKLRQTLTLTNKVCGNCGRYEMKLQHEPTIGIMAHEVAHGIQYKRYEQFNGKKWHCNKHKRLMAKVLKVIEKNFNSWRDMANKKANRKEESLQKKELRKQMQKTVTKERRKALKELKAKPEYKLMKLRQKMKAWEIKRKRAEKNLAKLKLKEKYMIKKCEVNQ